MADFCADYKKGLAAFVCRMSGLDDSKLDTTPDGNACYVCKQKVDPPELKLLDAERMCQVACHRACSKKDPKVKVFAGH